MAKAMLCLAFVHCVGASVVRTHRVIKTTDEEQQRPLHKTSIGFQILQLMTGHKQHNNNVPESSSSNVLNYINRLPFKPKMSESLINYVPANDELSSQNDQSNQLSSQESGPELSNAPSFPSNPLPGVAVKRTPMAELAIEHFSHIQDGDMCIRVCVDCRYRMSIHWAALCRKECSKGVIGNAFPYCFAAWHLEKGL